MKRLKIGIYSPYIDIFGGGERYILTVAEHLSQENDVFLFWNGNGLAQKVHDKFNIDISKVQCLPPDPFTIKNTLNTLKILATFDAFFYMTDGSIFLNPAKKNYCIIQSPLHCPPNSLSTKVKLLKWNLLCYSNFMADVIKKRLGKKAIVLAPPIDTDKSISVQKKDIIISVGRFFQRPHNKKQDILIEEFKSGLKTAYNGCTFILAGGLTEDSGKLFLDNLKKKAENAPIEFRVNPPYNELMTLFAQSKVYWHAAGFGEDLIKEPEKAEHFGITTIEAMSYGTVPVAFNGGGQKEIIADGVDGYLWNTTQELREKTNILLTNEEKRKSMEKEATQKAKKYSKEYFYESIDSILTK